MNVSIGEVQNIVSNSGITKYVYEMKGLSFRCDRQILRGGNSRGNIIYIINYCYYYYVLVLQKTLKYAVTIVIAFHAQYMYSFKQNNNNNIIVMSCITQHH